jgi:hypothetical protein
MGELVNKINGMPKPDTVKFLSKVMEKKGKR